MTNLVWSKTLDAAPRGLALAREAQRLLVWTEGHHLVLLSRSGHRQHQIKFASPIIAAAISEDGNNVVAATSDGRVLGLEPDLSTRWEHSVRGKPTAVAIDPLGMIAAVATNQNQLAFFYSDGEAGREAQCPRPAHHLAFIPGATSLIAAADLGWVASFNLEAGDWVWRDAPVVNFGCLAVAGSGDPILLTCFTEGLRAYRRNGEVRRISSRFGACRLVAINYHADLVVTATMEGVMEGSDLSGKLRFSFKPTATVSAMALSALGEDLYLVQGDGAVAAHSLPVAVV